MADSEDTIGEKERRLLASLARTGSVVVALSGGVDSAYLAWAAARVLGDRALAVTSDSPSFPASQRGAVERAVAQSGVPHEWIRTREMEVEGYVRNLSDRCYFCKTELYGDLAALAAERGYAAVLDGTNWDDLGDHRPGRVAAEERGVRSPLVECEVTKSEVRELARRAGLDAWDAPASACLSSRVPHGTPVTIRRLTQVERGEEALRALGFRHLRLRHHGELARVEVAADELARALDPATAERMVRALKPLGFRWVALDLEGYRTGSMNAVGP